MLHEVSQSVNKVEIFLIIPFQYNLSRENIICSLQNIRHNKLSVSSAVH